jgi:hypothetical protein
MEIIGILVLINQKTPHPLKPKTTNTKSAAAIHLDIHLVYSINAFGGLSLFTGEPIDRELV